jgi:hypothetical protein
VAFFVSIFSFFIKVLAQVHAQDLGADAFGFRREKHSPWSQFSPFFVWTGKVQFTTKFSHLV